jgi:hypothetical protein
VTSDERVGVGGLTNRLGGGAAYLLREVEPWQGLCGGSRQP